MALGDCFGEILAIERTPSFSSYGYCAIRVQYNLSCHWWNVMPLLKSTLIVPRKFGIFASAPV
jgi:hypothetical protein